jgi:hypothetical protein
MKFLVPNYNCLQNPLLGGYRPHIPVLSVLCPQLNLFTPPPPPNKIRGYATVGYKPRLLSKCCFDQNIASPYISIKTKHTVWQSVCLSVSRKVVYRLVNDKLLLCHRHDPLRVRLP